VLVLDDTDPLIKYNGIWPFRNGTIKGISYNETRLGTNRTGDSFTFQFVGASISVYGLLHQLEGRLSSSYSIDGAKPVTFSPYNATQKRENDKWAFNQRFFHQDLFPGNHTLTVTVNEISDAQVFWFDYLTYEGISSTKIFSPNDNDSVDNNDNKSGFKFEILAAAFVPAVIIALILFFVFRARYKKRRSGWLRTPLNNRVSTYTVGDATYMEIPVLPSYPTPPSSIRLTPSTSSLINSLTPRAKKFALPNATDDGRNAVELQREVEHSQQENERIQERAQQLQSQPPLGARPQQAEGVNPAEAPPPYHNNNSTP